MIKRRRVAVLGLLAAVAASIVVLPASSASAADQTYTNACRNSAVGTNWDQVNVTLGATSPSSVAAGGSLTLSGIHQNLAVPGAIFVAGYNLGLLTTGSNSINADLHSVIDAANTVQLSQSTNTVNTTLTTTISDPDGVPGSGDETATDASSPSTSPIRPGPPVRVERSTSTSTTTRRSPGPRAAASSPSPTSPVVSSTSSSTAPPAA